MDPDARPPGTGEIVLGDKGGITHQSHGAGGTKLFPEEKFEDYKLPPQKLPRVEGHRQDWLAAIRKGTRTGSDRSYGGPLTEIGLLGVIASRFSDKQLRWDGPAMRFTNSNEATKLLAPRCREGWKLRARFYSATWSGSPNGRRRVVQPPARVCARRGSRSGTGLTPLPPLVDRRRP